jgi:hypothetical protein
MTDPFSLPRLKIAARSHPRFITSFYSLLLFAKIFYSKDGFVKRKTYRSEVEGESQERYVYSTVLQLSTQPASNEFSVSNQIQR